MAPWISKRDPNLCQDGQYCRKWVWRYESCIGCQACHVSCPYDAVKMEERPSWKTMSIYFDGKPLQVPSGISIKEALQLSGFPISLFPKGDGIFVPCEVGLSESTLSCVGIPYNRDLISMKEVERIGKAISNIDPNLQSCVLDYRPEFRRGIIKGRTIQTPSYQEMVEVYHLLRETGPPPFFVRLHWVISAPISRIKGDELSNGHADSNGGPRGDR